MMSAMLFKLAKLSALCRVTSQIGRIYALNSNELLTSSHRAFTSGCIYCGRGVLKDGEKATQLRNEDWRERLTPEQFSVCREKGTEIPFAGKYVNHHDNGNYTCVCCGASLFSSTTKFDSGSGWPSFYDADSKNILKRKDYTFGMSRTEVLCKKCGSHLGHLFDDGPKPTSQRYCINSEALAFTTDDET